MSIQGLNVAVKFQPPVPFTDEWIDAIYASLEKNMAIVSVDMFVNEDEGEINFLLGVNNFMNTDSLAEGIAHDAIERALADAAGPNHAPDPDVTAGRVEEFA